MEEDCSLLLFEEPITASGSGETCFSGAGDDVVGYETRVDEVEVKVMFRRASGIGVY